jgi:hypothetical protein
MTVLTAPPDLVYGLRTDRDTGAPSGFHEHTPGGDI